MDNTNFFRKKELYETLERIGTDCFIDQEELVRVVGLYPRQNTPLFHNSTARRILSRDIQEINADQTFPKIILSASGTKGLKLATDEEALEYIRRQKLPCFKKMKRLSAIEQKITHSGQYDLEGNEYGRENN